MCKLILLEQMNTNRKKVKSAKKLEFEGENVAFVFQARKPLTRHTKNLKENSKEVKKLLK